jgi:hypothetical protein
MSCPLIDSDNPNCSASLNMQRLNEAYEFCADHYEMCPLFIQWSNKKLVAVGAEVSSQSTGNRRVIAMK